jgi:two-component system, cell cycle sensor histidine kinase and response regulator CckA
MVQGLLSFGRTWAAEPRPSDLNQLLSDTIRVVRRAMGDNLSIQIEPDDSLENVLLDPSLIQQVLLNLCLTARSTMSAGGTLTFHTGDVALSENEASLRPEVHAGRYARLSLEAVHVAAAGETATSCFSTEVVDPENGIGLATVYRIIQDHHGWVDLKPPQGNVEIINLYLPFEETVAQADQTVPQDISHSGELLLVLEEVDMIASFITTVMEMRGYLVITARQAGIAWELFEARRDEIAAAIVNAGTPGGSGVEFARHVRIARPDLPLVLTGADAMREDDPLKNDDHIAVLQRPFRADHLAQVVRNLIDARSVSQ